MLALHPRTVDAVWAAVEPLIPEHRPTPHPLGCHRPRIADRVCFEGILRRLVTGCSWDVAGRISGAGETTLRRRRSEWLAAGVFEKLRLEATAAYDRIIGLDLSESAIDGSQHKAPFGGEGTGPNPTDRAKLGWKWSIAVDANGIPIGRVIAGANRNDSILLTPTLDAVAADGLLIDIETLHLDRGYDSHRTLARLADAGIVDAVIQKRGTKDPGVKKQPIRLGLRWIVEATNSWLSNYGQLRRNTDRRERHRHAALSLATVVLMVGRLLDYRNRWSPT